jgi:hypothetical protein
MGGIDILVGAGTDRNVCSTHQITREEALVLDPASFEGWVAGAESSKPRQVKPGLSPLSPGKSTQGFKDSAPATLQTKFD